MFFKRRKGKKVAGIVLRQLQPLLTVVERFAGVKPAELVSDRYVLGFVCGNISIEMMRAAGTPLDQAEKGTILFTVLEQLFHPAPIRQLEIETLFRSVSPANSEFRRGVESAMKIHAVESGDHKLKDDPDYIAARALVRSGAMDSEAHAASEDSKIASEMLRSLFFQPVIDRYRKPSNSAPAGRSH